MGLESQGNRREGGGQGGFSGSGNDGRDDKDKKKKKEEGLNSLLKGFKWGGLVSPAFSLAAGLTKVVEYSQEKRRERLGEEAFAAEQAALAESEAARELSRNEKADLERNRSVKPLIPNTGISPIVPNSPAPVLTPVLGTPYVPGLMGTPTVKKRKLLGGDLMKRI